MNCHKRRIRRLAASLIATLAVTCFLCPAALADTDGTEIQVAQPDKLVLQLGTRWAGVEFELRTDAGVFPVPVVVDDSGVLKMDLGGSKTYTLTCINSSVPIPDPGTESGSSPEGTQPPDSQTADTVPQDGPAPAAPARTIPTTHLVLFFGGLIAAVGGLIVLHVVKKRREYSYDDWDDESEEEL